MTDRSAEVTKKEFNLTRSIFQLMSVEISKLYITLREQY